MRTIRIVILTATVATLAALVTGCAAAAPTPTTTSTAKATNTAKTIPGLPAGVTPSTSIPAAVPNTAKARQNVELDSCKKTPQGWEAAGVARNPGKTPASYTITVFFTTATATVIESAQAKVSVRPGAKSNWTAAASFTAPAKTLCVLRGVG